MSNILIAEDEDILRRHLTLILNSAGYFVTPARNTVEALSLLKDKRFDVLITDLVLPTGGGSALITYVTDRCPDMSVIIITAYPSANSAIDAVKKGVTDYFTKPFKTEDILKAVKKVVEGKKEVPFAWEKLKAFGLTKKEESLLRLIVENGFSQNQELAEKLSIKIPTVKQHLTNMFGKFGVDNKTSLISEVIKALRK
jgi:DNA-binding NarL/FixJ family response regulator